MTRPSFSLNRARPEPKAGDLRTVRGELCVRRQAAERNTAGTVIGVIVRGRKPVWDWVPVGGEPADQQRRIAAILAYVDPDATVVQRRKGFAAVPPATPDIYVPNALISSPAGYSKDAARERRFAEVMARSVSVSPHEPPVLLPDGPLGAKDVVAAINEQSGLAVARLASEGVVEIAGAEVPAGAAPDPPCTCDGNGSTTCWDCGGSGGFHDCGDDSCPCADPEEPTDTCQTCEGKGWLRCPGCLAAAPPADADACDGSCGFSHPHRRREVAT